MNTTAKLLPCERCGHSLDGHSGAGCAELRCPCRASKDQILDAYIALATREHRERFTN